MRGPKIPTAKRLINSVPPLNPADFSEVNANNIMFLEDGLGTGEFLEDSSILVRHLFQLHAREQASPNLTLEVLAGVGWFSQNSYVSFAGGSSPSFTAPAANPRIDILTLRSDGSIQRIAGVEAGSPVAPTIPSTDIPLAQIYNVVGQTKIHDNDTQEVGQGYIQYDLRPFIQVAVGSSAMPKIGLIARAQNAQSSTASGAYDSGTVDVVNFSGAGRLRSIHQTNTNSGGPPHDLYLTIIIDGVTTSLSTLGVIAAAEYDAASNFGGSTTQFKIATGTTTSVVFMDIFFKSSLQIQHRLVRAAGTGSMTLTSTVEYERE